MIYGKTSKVAKRSESDNNLDKINGVEEFAYFPTKLHDGRTIWLQKYYCYYHGGVRETKDGPVYFLWSCSPEDYCPYGRASVERDDSLINIQ